MPADIDPLSQLIGGLTAQVSNIARDITDLRSEVISNRNLSGSWREDMTRKLESVQVEFRSAKHDYRAFEQAKIAMDGRLSELEDMLTKWRIRAAGVIGASAIIGAIMGAIAEPILHYSLVKLFG